MCMCGDGDGVVVVTKWSYTGKAAHAPLDGRLLQLGGVDLVDAREDDVVDTEKCEHQEGREEQAIPKADAVVRLCGC